VRRRKPSIGGAGMLAIVLIGYGSAHALTSVTRRQRAAART
jgi:hypothetical protein